MFQDFLMKDAAAVSAAIVIVTMLLGWLLRRRYNCNCENEDTKTSDKKKLIAMKAVTLLLFAAAGLYIGNLINIGTTFMTALSHGMSTDPETGQYNLKYGEMITLNKHSVKESNVNIYDLKNKAVIYVRYDCPDCVILHEQLASIDNMIFLSSRTQKGKTARELYNINLTEVPQGVYIDPEGKATTICIMQNSGDALTLDFHQIEILRSMVKEEN